MPMAGDGCSPYRPPAAALSYVKAGTIDILLHLG